MPIGQTTLTTKSLYLVTSSKYIGGGPVSWRSRKQSSVALSTAEAEYMSLTLAAQEAIRVNRLLAELQSRTEPLKPATLYEDKKSAICMTKTPQFHGRRKSNITLSGMKLRKECNIVDLMK